MLRRGFLYRLPALLGLVVGARQAGAAALAQHPSEVAKAAAERRVELQRSPVAGFQYHEGEAVWPLLAEGTPLELVREPENTYDARAVRVDWQGHKLGYLPRVENAAASHLLDGGERLSARIVALRQSSNPWQRVEVAVELRV